MYVGGVSTLLRAVFGDQQMWYTGLKADLKAVFWCIIGIIRSESAISPQQAEDLSILLDTRL